MSDVQFDTEQYSQSDVNFADQSEGGVTGFMMKMGAKDKSQANIIMLVMILVCFGVVAFVFWPSSNSVPPPTPEQLRSMSMVQQTE